MSAQSSNTLKNDVARIEIYNLAKLAAKHPDFPMPPGGRGPFAIYQEGVAPGDMTFTPMEFFLTREGKWLPFFAFIVMEVEERRQLCIFNTSAEAMQHLSELTGPAVLDVERIAKAKGAGGN